LGTRPNRPVRAPERWKMHMSRCLGKWGR
jgi:hypothetical protein